MRVSAIVPTFNRAHMVRRAIESIINQSHDDIEIIVVDDGSEDATEEVVKAVDPRGRILRYVRKPNGGCASARNYGLQLAGGELIGFLDSDDEWLPNAVESLVRELIRAGADFVYSPNIEHIDENNQFTSYPAAMDRPADFAVEHFMTSRARPCSLLYRRKIFEQLRFDETLRYNEDSDFLQRVAISHRAAYCSSPTAIVYHHATNKSKNTIAILRALQQSAESILKDHPEFAKQLGARADVRRRQIRRRLAEALFKAGDVAGAREVAAGAGLGLDLEVLLRVGWVRPLYWQDRARWARHALTEAVKKWGPLVLGRSTR